jgi:hypothetical protein
MGMDGYRLPAIKRITKDFIRGTAGYGEVTNGELGPFALALARAAAQTAKTV